MTYEEMQEEIKALGEELAAADHTRPVPQDLIDKLRALRMEALAEMEATK